MLSIWGEGRRGRAFRQANYWSCPPSPPERGCRAAALPRHWGLARVLSPPLTRGHGVGIIRLFRLSPLTSPSPVPSAATRAVPSSTRFCTSTSRGSPRYRPWRCAGRSSCLSPLWRVAAEPSPARGVHGLLPRRSFRLPPAHSPLALPCLVLLSFFLFPNASFSLCSR